LPDAFEKIQNQKITQNMPKEKIGSQIILWREFTTLLLILMKKRIQLQVCISTRESKGLFKYPWIHP
jgi:hypothetical protein